MELRAFRVREGSVVELPGASVAWERELQRLVEANAEVMLGVRFVASEYATGRHRGRIDTLGLDENGTPVIVEYKRTRDASVITQGLSYLSWLEDSRPEFESLVRERLGAAVVETVDWSNPRLICVAAEFSPHDSVALEVIGRRVDLVAYRMFGDVLTLQLVASVAGTAPPRRGRAVTAARTSASGGAPKSVTQYLEASPPELRELFAELDRVLLSYPEVQKETQLHYIAYRRIRNVATVRVQPRKRVLVVNLRVDPSTVELCEGFSRDVSEVGCLGTGDLEVRIRSAADLERANELIRRSVESG
ncbi:DUF5655 domain-containing protein [Streptomyces calidiresistens]|uniref:endonuclease NucS domain-containing protein n=1 Tax=Streptomyces calidiresistens TaxID=1485586 RepID=UPI002B204034|nr:endonuclease NucS domain-containing protein [Streptomyces calidiresistens]